MFVLFEDGDNVKHFDRLKFCDKLEYYIESYIR